MERQRKYEFSWRLLGDMVKGRPNLGLTTRLEVYRLMQFSFRDVVELHFGTETADQLFYEAGKLAGKEFYNHYIDPGHDLPGFIRQLQATLRELGMGIVRVEKSDPVQGLFIITVAEDLDCSGLPELDYEICTYDEGFFAALLESFTGTSYKVKEIDCWCTGDRTCRFLAEAVQ